MTKAIGRLFTVLITLNLLFAGGAAASARDDGYGYGTGITPPRLSLADGDVSFWRPGAEDWAPARLNTALAAGDQLYAGRAANLELQIGARAYVRAGEETQIGLENLESDFMQFKV